MENKEKEGVKLKCKRCGYQWEYTGDKAFGKWPAITVCPNCRTSVKLPIAES